MSAESYREAAVKLEPRDRGILALDRMSHRDSAEMQSKLIDFFGIAKENSKAQSGGWLDAVRRNRSLGYLLMADAKYHDTTETMYDHLLSTTQDGAHFITLHASTGVKALKSAVAGRDEGFKLARTTDQLAGTLLGITVLTHLSDEQCIEIYGKPALYKVMEFAGYALEAGLEGIVCSGLELPHLQRDPDLAKLVKVVPGIVLPGSQKPSGQSRTVSPEQAISEGADFLVAGRTVTAAEDSLRAAEQFVTGIALAA